MNAYIYQASLYCEDCITQIKGALRDRDQDPDDSYRFYDWPYAPESAYDSDDYPKGPYPNGGGEADTPQHCDSCGLFLENPLTEDGEQYVLEAFNTAWDDPTQGNPEVINQWTDYYDYLDLAPIK